MTSSKYWQKWTYLPNNTTYWENSKECWTRCEWDDVGDVIYFEDSDGKIEDNRPPHIIEVTMADIEKKFGCKVMVVK